MAHRPLNGFVLLCAVKADNELISADARNQIFRLQTSCQFIHNPGQQSIPRQMTVGIIETLEAVNIQHQESIGMTICRQLLHGMNETCAIEGMGQGIGFGTVHQKRQFPLFVIHPHKADLQCLFAIPESGGAADANPAFLSFCRHPHLKQAGSAVLFHSPLFQRLEESLRLLLIFMRYRPAGGSMPQICQLLRYLDTKTICQAAFGVEQPAISQGIFAHKEIPFLKGVRADKIPCYGCNIHPPDNILKSIHHANPHEVRLHCLYDYTIFSTNTQAQYAKRFAIYPHQCTILSAFWLH